MDTEPQWAWPSDMSAGANTDPRPAPAPNDIPAFDRGDTTQQVPPRRYFSPRTCRICLEQVEPAFPASTNALLGVLGAKSRPVYQSQDGGRLISPCKCKGSQKYVHEGCLKEWRLADPAAKRNYFQCPTCSFKYQLQRISLAHTLSSAFAQVCMTISIFIVAAFLLGFVADPIFNLWFDPLGTITDSIANVMVDVEDTSEPYSLDEPGTWLDHFLKGIVSIGLIGFLKSFFAISPWQWWNMRSNSLAGRSRSSGGNGRARVENISWTLVMVGVITAIVAIWKGVRKFSASTLRMVSDRVLDIGGENDDDNDEPAGDDAAHPSVAQEAGNEGKKDI